IPTSLATLAPDNKPSIEIRPAADSSRAALSASSWFGGQIRARRITCQRYPFHAPGGIQLPVASNGRWMARIGESCGLCKSERKSDGKSSCLGRYPGRKAGPGHTVLFRGAGCEGDPAGLSGHEHWTAPWRGSIGERLSLCQ